MSPSQRALLVVLVALGCAVTICDAACAPACLNGGACTTVEGLANEYYCKCPTGWWGPQCAAKYEQCPGSGLVCYNGGKCVADGPGSSYTCSCPSTWTDPQCKTAVKACNDTSLVCMNGGQCMEDVNGAYCSCPPNIRGRQCQFGVRECQDGMYCMNDGVCSDDSKTCVCKAGFFGFHCQNNERDPNADKIARPGLPGWAIALIVIGCLAAVGLGCLAGFLIWRERKGTPVFQKYDTAGMMSGSI